jgi:hypothetical protein
MVRNTVVLLVVFTCGALIALLLRPEMPWRVYAGSSDIEQRLQALDARLAAVERQQTSMHPQITTPGLPANGQPAQQGAENPPHLIPIKEEPWQQQVDDRLGRLEKDAQSQGQQLAKLSPLPAQVSQLEFRFDNHYHTLQMATDVPTKIETILTCDGHIGGNCYAAIPDKVIPVVMPNGVGKGPSVVNQPTSTPKVDVNPQNH